MWTVDEGGSRQQDLHTRVPLVELECVYCMTYSVVADD